MTSDSTNATPKKSRRLKYSEKVIIEALRAANGGIYLAAKKLGCAASNIYIRADKSPAIQAVIDEMRGELGDMAEAALKRAVVGGEGWAVCFTLKTLGKSRGYIERTETAQVGVQTIRIIHEDADAHK